MISEVVNEVERIAEVVAGITGEPPVGEEAFVDKIDEMVVNEAPEEVLDEVVQLPPGTASNCPINRASQFTPIFAVCRASRVTPRVVAIL